MVLFIMQQYGELVFDYHVIEFEHHANVALMNFASWELIRHSVISVLPPLFTNICWSMTRNQASPHGF